MADDGVRGRIRRAVGAIWDRLQLFRHRPETEAAAEPDEPSVQPAGQCAVCGTAVDPGDDRCPLCRSSDIETADSIDEPEETPNSSGTSGGQPAERRLEDTGGAEAALADLNRQGGDPLVRHDDKWSTRDNSARRYRVDLPDGGVTFVDSKEDVRALLFRHYGAGED